MITLNIAYIVVVTDYKYSLYDLAEESVEREKAKHEAHVRSANRLKDLCFKNGGIYIKLGQHIGQLVMYCQNILVWILLELSPAIIIDVYGANCGKKRGERKKERYINVDES